MIVKISSERDCGNGESSFKLDFAYEKADLEKATHASCSKHGIYKKLLLVVGCPCCASQSA